MSPVVRQEQSEMWSRRMIRHLFPELCRCFRSTRWPWEAPCCSYYLFSNTTGKPIDALGLAHPLSLEKIRCKSIGRVEQVVKDAIRNIILSGSNQRPTIGIWRTASGRRSTPNVMDGGKAEPEFVTELREHDVRMNFIGSIRVTC